MNIGPKADARLLLTSIWSDRLESTLRLKGEKMTAQEVLCQYVDRYVKLSARYSESSKRVTEAYGKLRDLLLVELYFMKPVRILVHEEEMSGFVIYVEKKLRDIVDSYQPEKSEFMPYFSHIMEYRALNYLEEKRRSKLISHAYENYYMCQAEEVAERSPEEIYMEKLGKLEDEKKQKKLMDKLRYVCACRPSRRRNLFILLCTLLPYLPSDAIDDFCRVLNCNREQTFAIADYLRSVQDEKDLSRGSRLYNRNRLDSLWVRKMEMEYAFEHSARRNRTLAENIRRISAMISSIESDTRKMNVEYPVLGKLLNMEPYSIAYAVYAAKKLLSVVLGEEPDSGYIGRQANTTTGRRYVRLKRLDPFKEFGIRKLRKRTRYPAAS